MDMQQGEETIIFAKFKQLETLLFKETELSHFKTARDISDQIQEHFGCVGKLLKASVYVAEATYKKHLSNEANYDNCYRNAINCLNSLLKETTPHGIHQYGYTITIESLTEKINQLSSYLNQS